MPSAPGRPIGLMITRNTVAILPVHIVGDICDTDRIHGTLGDLGCFSFQNRKSLTSGEGGAGLGHDDKLIDRCYSLHNLGLPHGSVAPKHQEGHPIVATKCRMAEYQASILMTQMETCDSLSFRVSFPRPSRGREPDSNSVLC